MVQKQSASTNLLKMADQNSDSAMRTIAIDAETSEHSIPELFEKTAARYPNRLAIKHENCLLTYSALNQAANRIGRAVLAKRGQRSEPVALLFEQGIDAIAAIFGTLKAGKHYVALDPAFPPERNLYMIENSQARLIVTNGQTLAIAQSLATGGAALLNVDDLDNGSPCDNLALRVAPESPMRVLYTSGSTGNPKGVLRNQFTTLEIARDTDIGPDDRLSLIHSVSFGSASVSLFSSLLNGASLFLFDIRRNGIQRLASWLHEEQITFCHLPPAVFRELKDSLFNLKHLPSLRLICLSGSPITQRDFDLYKTRFPSSTLLNIVMGSTEAGRCFSAILDHNFVFPLDGTPLGYPLPGKKVFLLDNQGCEVEPNQIGEIAIKSRNLSSGYLTLPELTSAKFLTDKSEIGESMYLTGDLGRMLPDGFLIYIGRKDAMVKIRGFRVELCEIENALLANPKIHQAGVVAWEREPQETFLVGYIVARGKPAPRADELRSFLKDKLPEYMIPSSFVFLESLPLINGKLDRKTLPRPSNERPDLDCSLVAPRDEVEQKLAAIWADVLGIERVGIHDDFFDLGGHSLLAARLFVRLDKTFGKQLPAATITYARTIEQLADIVSRDVNPAPSSLLVPIQPKGSKPPFFWACGFTSDIYLPRYLAQDQPLYGLLNQCHDGKKAAFSRLEDIAAHHLKEIRAIQAEGPYYLGGFCFGGMVAFEMARQLKHEGQEVDLLFLVDLATIKNCKALTDQLVDIPISLDDVKSFQAEISRHLGKITALKPRDKLTYVSVRVVDRIKGGISLCRELVKDLICRVCLKRGHPIPPSFRLHYISKIDRQMICAYDPQPYTDRLILFKAKESAYDPRLVEKLTSADVEINEIACRHSELIKESHIGLWAEKLKRCLSEAQAKATSKVDYRTASKAVVNETIARPEF